MSDPRYAFQHSVLFIDKNAQMEQLLRSGLLLYPVQFEFCDNHVDAAIKKIEATNPDLIVSSLEFEKGNPLDLAKAIAKRQHRTTAIYVVDPGVEEIQKQILQTGGVFDLFKRESEFSELIRKMDHAVRVTREFKRTRAEAFVALDQESRASGVTVNELLMKRKSAG